MIKPRTDPLRCSAPLPPNTPINLPTLDQIDDEVKRASAELMWALHRQRTAWDRMSTLKAEYDQRPNHEFIDNERPWKLAVGDVQWWRGEVSSRANAILALRALAAAVPNQIRAYNGSKSAQSAVYGWDPATSPTLHEVNSARAWMKTSSATPTDRGRMLAVDWNLCIRLIRAYRP